MREAVLSRLRALGAEERLAREAALERRLGELERELAEVRQLIPAWSRIFFFDESADVRREKDLEAQVAATRRDLEVARGARRKDLETVSDELPPFGVACLLDDVLACSERWSTAEPGLAPALERLARRLLAVWAPDFDHEKVLETLASAIECRAAAQRNRGIPADERLVHAPARPGDLLPVLAARLLEGPYFESQERVFELTSRRNRLVDDHEKAADGVPLLHRLNPFRTSPAEKRRNELADELRRTRDELRVERAESRRLLEECVRGFPPLGLHRSVLETIAVAARPDLGKELALGAGGHAIDVPVDRSRVLVAASVARLEETFRAAFPGVPLPRELARELGARVERVPPPLEPLVRAFLGELSRSRAPELLDRALEHAHAAAASRRARERVEKGISLAAKLAFWAESDEKDERDSLLERERWHQEKEKLARIELSAAAREMGAVLAPFRLRDATLEALRELQHVSTNPGQHPVHLLPSVFGIDAALRSLEAVRRVLEQTWDLSFDEGEMLDAIFAAEPEDVAVAPHERLLWKPLSEDKLARLLAFRLERTGFQETYRRIKEIEERERAVASEKSEVASRLSIWDHLNVFSKSPDKQRNKELARILRGIGAELEASVERLRAHLDHALHVYPPARLYFSLPAVERAIREIHAVCKPIWITVKYREPIHIMEDELTRQEAGSEEGPLVVQVGRPKRFQGWVERERQELRYICVLVGKEEAQHALGSWAARVVGCFGELPGYQELLETWARSFPRTTSSPSPLSSTPSGPTE